MLTASAWAQNAGRTLHILTVDHGLRAAAREESAFVAGLARDLGHGCTCLSLHDLRSVQAETRQARQRALALACREIGAQSLLTGHTLDDQLETFLMRARQGSGPFGLGGIDVAAPSPVWPEGRGLTLVRPLLSLCRANLRVFLKTQGQDWRDDPSNSDPGFERVRMRRMLDGDADLRAQVTSLQAAFAVLRRAEQRGLAREIAARVEAHSDATLRIDFSELPAARAERMLGLAVQLSAGHARIPRSSQLQPVLESLSSVGRRFTLAGAWLEVEDGRNLRLARDPGLVVPGWRDGIWDNRFERVDGPEINASHPMAARSLPGEDSGWHALAPGRLALICDIWRRMSLLSQ